MFSSLLRRLILKNFFAIDLSSMERQIAVDSIEQKYARVLWSSCISAILIVPAIIFLDTNVVVSVLIPITMVSGTAWFAVSLANVRKKFEGFGVELTTNLFESFITSLFVLLLLTLSSLNKDFLEPVSAFGSIPWVRLTAGILGSIVMARLIFVIFAGSLKYDINDAMLTGQNEVAERFYKRSLSFLHQSAASLKSGKDLEVANYHIGNSFLELFSFIRTKLRTENLYNGRLDSLIQDALKIRNNPKLSQSEIDAMSLNLIERFLYYCADIQDTNAQKSFFSIEQEMKCLKENTGESQQMTDTRFATILMEIAELLEGQGEALFVMKEVEPPAEPL